METPTLSTNCAHRSLGRFALLFVSLVFAGFGLLSKAQAVSPPPDGGYPGGNTAEGTNALLNLAGGTNNTAVGFTALLSDTTGGGNTAVGANALFSNTIGSNNTAYGQGALHNSTSGSSSTATGFQAL